MVSRILHTSYVIDFMDCDFSTDHISAILKEEADSLLQRFPIDSLAEWKVQFKAAYGPKSPIRVFKKMPSYTQEKQKLIISHLPIPTRDIVAWGVEPRQHIKLGTHPNGEYLPAGGQLYSVYESDRLYSGFDAPGNWLLF
jgi:hypothetical protein